VSRWAELDRGDGDQAAAAYQRRFDDLARSGVDVHGEADRCAALAVPGTRILDAGCGTGRVAVELARRGYHVVGVDLDDGMLDRARATAPSLTWIGADLATFDRLDHGLPDAFDLALAAGNVIPLVAQGTEPAVLARLAAAVRPGGTVVTGFGLDASHLPLTAVPFGLAEYDEWCASAGLTLVERSATWDGQPFQPGGGYAVNVHVRTS
jgi:SAM-dependent methyltransferase